MVLDHVADCPGLVIKLATILDAKFLSHRDLDATHMGAIPNRLKDRIGKTSVKDVLHRLLSQIVVDPEDVLLGKILMQDLAQFARRRPVVAKRLFDDKAGVGGAS